MHEFKTLKKIKIYKMFDRVRTNLCPAFFRVLILLVTVPAPALAAESAKPRDPIDIPLQTVAKTVESKERTPWGEARAKITYGFDEKESTVHFTRFTLPSKRAPDAKTLGKVIENFKNNYKCTARKSKRSFKFDPSCEVSAQLAWEGLCAAGERYLNVQFIAQGRLYEVGATRTMMQPEHNLARTVSDLTGRCQGARTENPAKARR